MKEARNVFKGIRFTSDEAERVQRAADAAGQTLAAYVHDAALRASDAHTETERLMEQQRALYEDVVASMQRRIATASANVLEGALADVAKRMADAQARVEADMIGRTTDQYSSIASDLYRLDMTVQGLVDAIKASAPPAAPPQPGKPAGLPCPVCRKGHMVATVGSTGKQFYSCSTHPTCKHTSWSPNGA